MKFTPCPSKDSFSCWTMLSTQKTTSQISDKIKINISGRKSQLKSMTLILSADKSVPVILFFPSKICSKRAEMFHFFSELIIFTSVYMYTSSPQPLCLLLSLRGHETVFLAPAMVLGSLFKAKIVY